MLSTAVALFSLFCFSVFTISSVHCVRDKSLSKNVSTTLDQLLATDRYDKRIRPDFGGPPVRISINFDIKSLGPVSDNDETFGLDCYLRQHWYDMRLRYDKLPGLTEFSLSWLFLDKVWKPDTYFVNGKKSFLHKITAPNKFLRLRYDGFLTYSMRLTISASCPMYLRKFPLDAQKCPLIIGSYGYTTKDVVYNWTDNPIAMPKKMEIAQFDLTKVTAEGEKFHQRGDLAYSILEATFSLQRHTGYFMLQVYVPCGLIVVCSWVSFWIDPDAVPARVNLGVTTVLSLTTMGFGGRAQLPKVSYWTALDWFVIICFTSVFSVMIEYACVNFIDKVTKDLKKAIEKKRKEQEQKAALLQQVQGCLEAQEVGSENLPGRQRSASMSVLQAGTTPEEDICRRSSINVSQKGGTQDTENESPKSGRLKLTDIPRRLSTTVKDWIQKPSLSSHLSRSIQNLSKLERGFSDTDMRVPKIVVSDEEEEEYEIEGDEEDSEWQDEDLDDEEPPQRPSPFTTCIKIRDLYRLWLEWKFLPQEGDVVQLMASAEPPDKFSRIDIQSRRSFPIAFLTSLTLYLFTFAYYLNDDLPERDPNRSLAMN